MAHHVVGLRQFAVAALFNSHVHHHRAGAHGFDHGARDQHRCLAAGDEGRGDHHVGLTDALGHGLGLAFQPGRRHRACIATHTGGGLAFLVGLVGHVDELGTQRLDLLLHGRTHVRGLDHRTQTAGRGDGLQTGHAGAQDDHTGCLGGTRSRHHHGEEALIQVGGDQHGLVSCNIGLR